MASYCVYIFSVFLELFINNIFKNFYEKISTKKTKCEEGAFGALYITQKTLLKDLISSSKKT